MEKMRYPEGGFTLIEVFISLAITGLIMTSAYGLFIGQNKSYQAQQDTIRLFREAQNAMGILAKDLRMTGYGVPQAASRITVANGTTLTVSGNFRRVSTTLSAVAASGQTALPVQGITGFAVGDAIWITNGTNSESKTISGISGGGSPSLTVNSSLSNSYNAASMVHQNRTLTYTYTGGGLSRTVQGGTAQTLLQDVTAFSFTYTYSGAASPANVRQITVSLTAQTRLLPDTGKRQTLTLGTTVVPQNLAF